MITRTLAALAVIAAVLALATTVGASTPPTSTVPPPTSVEGAIGITDGVFVVDDFGRTTTTIVETETAIGVAVSQPEQPAPAAMLPSTGRNADLALVAFGSLVAGLVLVRAARRERGYLVPDDRRTEALHSRAE